MSEELNQDLMEEELFDLVSKAASKVSLAPPLLITEEMGDENPKLKWLLSAYRRNDEVKIEMQMAISLINYLLTQNKAVVEISKRLLEKLVLEDFNWKIKKPFSENSYKDACLILSKLNIKRIAWSSEDRLAVLLSFPNSPTYEHYTGDLEYDLVQIFKQNKTTLSDFKVDEYRKCFTKYIEN